MIAIDRENSKGLWAYKLLDGNEIKIIEEGLKNKGKINHLYVIKNTLDNSLYLFGGNSKENYKNYIGFLTTEDELKIHSKDLFNLYNMDYEFNFSWKEDSFI